MARKPKAFTIKAFATWLDAKGAVILPTTNEWELIRFRTDAGVSVVHRNSKGLENWPTEAERLRGVFIAGLDENLAPGRAARRKLRSKILDLAKRDGLECWYRCGVVFDDADDERITIEHLCPHSFGGPNHAANLCLSCEPCNRKAGNLHVSTKVRIREENGGQGERT